MNLLLTTVFEDHFEYNDRILNVDMSFDNILLLFELFDDEEVDDQDKIFLSLQVLIDEYDDLEFETIEEMNELFYFVLKEFLDIDLKAKKNSGEKGIKVYDFKKDAELIYASFYAVYKIDLFEMKGKLHWRKFNALLTHLDDNSPFKQVIGYRTMKVPSEKEASKDYINHVRNMKAVYALEEEDESPSALDELATIFKS